MFNKHQWLNFILKQLNFTQTHMHVIHHHLSNVIFPKNRTPKVSVWGQCCRNLKTLTTAGGKARVTVFEIVMLVHALHVSKNESSIKA
jgi:hypothetical protein